MREREKERKKISAMANIKQIVAYLSSRRMKCVIATIGIFVSFFIFGWLQEEITRSQYFNENGEKEKFEFFYVLVGILCIWYALFAKGKEFYFYPE